MRIFLIASLFLTGCMSSIKRLSPSQLPSPVTSIQNATLVEIEEPLTGEIIPNSPDNITLYVNEVFTYLILIVLLICFLCILPTFIRYLSSKIRRSDRSNTPEQRIVLND